MVRMVHGISAIDWSHFARIEVGRSEKGRADFRHRQRQMPSRSFRIIINLWDHRSESRRNRLGGNGETGDKTRQQAGKKFRFHDESPFSIHFWTYLPGCPRLLVNLSPARAISQQPRPAAFVSEPFSANRRL